ncbi:MAG: hypothetical protein V1685_06155 [Parcubacteria group bacterium]
MSTIQSRIKKTLQKEFFVFYQGNEMAKNESPQESLRVFNGANKDH